MKGYLIFHMIALGCGILLDLLVGDPHFLPHPVRWMGRLILFLEKKLYPADPDRAEKRGTLLWILTVLSVGVVTGMILAVAYFLHPCAGVVTEAVMSAYALAATSLYRESMKVSKALGSEDLKEARYALSMIVGRDTEDLDRHEIMKAAVETVSENTSDGVIAPLVCLALGGPVLGYIYKAVNTMDSMLGYRNERYERFGRTAARADDVMNHIPARLSALLMILASLICGIFSKKYSGKDSLRIWLRDRRNHLSPNSAQTESVCAGALGLKLGGTHSYHGIPVEKPVIGDEKRAPETKDIGRANVLMYGTELLCVMILYGIFGGILIL